MSDHETNFTPEEQPKSTTNTILLYCTLGMLSFVGWGTFQNSVSLAKMEGQQVSRSELDTKLAEVHTKQSEIETEISSIQVQIAGIKAQRQ